ncbi:Bacteriohemerythrin [Fundidesulfovibrio magnetotacticus]|uniref:Bacteriohemerythrin n=1 Tax=Fundidesulfovibrio magnetotacticus TaxID=2730080 RepID=A0A6V8LS47_9BACT|nr:bacteriohemerythrin [Fundidesulfovibrio magnetotacticus]GFK93391.1 Bacteriohemerythrin [Fundidesulfovibrio magnetotacticus]
MARIEWHEGLALGIETIDRQHRTLLTLCNRLLDAVRKADEKAVAAAFRELREYTFSHFNAEEDYMQSVGYPGLGSHKLLHVELKRDVKYFQDVVYRKGDLTEAQIVEFLKHWLLDHILQYDLDIRKWTRAEGKAT